MAETRYCPQCRTALPASAPEGFCPVCEFRGALDPPAPENTSASPTPVVPEAGDRIGRYKLLEKIGEGGCGIVYMAEQEEPVRRRVALKIIKLGMDTKEVIARFEAERQALALMEHPHIATIFDGGATDAGRPYFVMELVRGIKITNFCDESKVSTTDRLKLFIQVCQAIQHAHQKGIIHRDLKPSNILVTVNDGMPVPKVIDFGIAKATGQALTDKTFFTRFNHLIGTPAYMSPEQAEMTSVDIDTRSDIYSLGVLLYELLTGRTPFDTKELLRAGMESMLRTIREKEPVRPSARLGTLAESERTTVAQQRQTAAPRLINLVRGDLDWIVMKCLEKDRSRRYETANGLASDIDRHLNNEMVVARAPSNLYRFQKLVRRNKLAFAAVGAVMMVLILGLGLSMYAFIHERHARKRAEAAEQEQARLRGEADKARANEARLREEAGAARANEAAEHKRAEATAGRLADTQSRLELERGQFELERDKSARAIAELTQRSLDASNLAASLAKAPSVSTNAGDILSLEYQIKAAYLFNFVKFVDWPPTAFPNATAGIQIGILGDDPFGHVLDRSLDRKTVRNRPLIIKRARQLEDLEPCHVLFVCKSEMGRLSSILSDLEGRSILTISDGDQFARQGGMIRFFSESNTIRFEINPAAAQKNGIKIVEQLLKLAKIVNDKGEP